MPRLALCRLSRPPSAVVATLLGLLAWVAWTAAGVLPAAAHDDLVSSVPTAGEQLAEPPTEVSLTFSATVNEQFAQVAVVDEAGTAYQSGPPVVAGDTVTQPVAGLPRGVSFTLSYRIVSVDGHPIGGTVPFSVAAGEGDAAAPSPAPTAPADTAEATPAVGVADTPAPQASPEPTAVPVTAAAATTEAGPSVLPWVLGGAALLAVAGLGLWVSRRSASTSDEPRQPAAPGGSG
jgi:methionine-rich copper-binding protein CopC